MSRPFIIRDAATRQRAIAHIANLRLGDHHVWDVIVRPHKKKRSLSQNAYLHKILQVIADDTGNSLDAVKDYYRDMFLGKVAVQLGEQERLVGRSTTTLSVPECGDFIEQIVAHSTQELGIMLPDASEVQRNG